MNRKGKLQLYFRTVIILLIFNPWTVKSQNEVAEFSPEWLDTTQSVYVSDYAEVFRSYLPARHLFKINLNGYFRSSQSFASSQSPYAWEGFTFAYERRIGRQYSAEFRVGLIPEFLFPDQSALDYLGGVGIGFRRYFNSSIKTEYCLEETNLSGLYLSAEVHYGHKGVKSHEFLSPDVKILYNSFGLGLGYQKRVLNHSFVNMKVLAGFDPRFHYLAGSREVNRRFFFYPSVEFGFAFGGQQSSRSSSCVLFNCQQEADELYKLDVFPMLNGNYWRDQLGFGVHFEREKRLGEGPFSYTTGIGLGVKDYHNSTNLLWSLFGDVRYYYNLKSRILRGRTANNFSASFISLELNTHNDRSDIVERPIGDYIAPDEIKFSNDLSLFWGIQRSVLDRGFIQGRAGTTFASGIFADNSYVIGTRLVPRLDLKVGFSF